jgi:cytochrome c-type biogenesis protein CcmH
MVSGMAMQGALFALVALVLVAAALAVVLRPLWRGAPGPTLALAGVLLAGTAALYLLVGTPAALDPDARRAPETTTDAIASLQAALEREPTLAEGWVLLGRAYRAEGRATEARDAFVRAADLLPDDATVQVEAAEASALAASDRRLDDTAVARLRRALAVEPGNQRARWFLGIAHRQRGEDAEAARVWEPLLADVDAKTAASLRPQIAAAREAAGLAPLPAPAVDAATDVAASIRVRVDIAPELATRIGDGAVLYVIARAIDGPPMPVAVERLPVTAFPIDVVLDDADGPMPTARLSQAGRVRVEARVSASGDAMARSGDLASAPVASEAGESVRLAIDRAVE